MSVHEQGEAGKMKFEDSPSSDLFSATAQLHSLDDELRMLSRYLDFPIPNRKQLIRRACAAMTEQLDAVLEMAHTAIDSLSTESMDAEIGIVDMIAEVLHDISSNHAELLADYTDDIVLPTEDESLEALDGLQAVLFDEFSTDFDSFATVVRDKFKTIIDSDIEIIEIEVAKKLWTAQQAARHIGRVAQIAAGAAIGALIADRLKPRR